MLRYENYRPSGTPWFGDIPSHWRVLPLFAVAKKKSVCNHPEKELLSVYLDKGVVKFSDVDEKRTNATSEDLSAYQEVLPSDFVLNNQQAWRGSVGVSKHEGIVSPAYIVLELAGDLHPQFANYLFRDGAMVSQYLVCSRGVGTIQRNLYWPQLKRAKVIIPPIEEQRAIATFLDKKTAEIDAAIAKKERLIELVQEQKSALIKAAVLGHQAENRKHQALVPWAEELPTHWKIKRAKHLFRQSRLTVKHDHEVVTAYRDGQVTLRANRRLDGYTFAILEQGYQGVMPGQLVINSMDAFAGAIGVSDSEGKCSPEYVVCDAIDRNEISPNFASLVLRQMAMSGYIEVICSAVRQRALRIRYNDFSPLFMPVPPMEEQVEIERLVGDINKRHDQMAFHLRQEISRLRDLFRLVIANAVTGQIRM